MLTYTHIYNPDIVTQPYNIACLDSDASNIAIYVNNNLQEIVSPNKTNTGMEFKKYKQSLTEQEILNILYSGTLVSYSNSLNKAIFSNVNAVFIKSISGKYLSLDTDNRPYWTDTTRSRFFFNPYYFDSSYLWQKIFKTKPDSSKISGLGDLASEVNLFNRKTLEVSTELIPKKIEPFRFSPFRKNGPTESIFISKIIEIKANFGDTISLKTDKDRIEFLYEPISASAMILPSIDNTSCTRPWIHIPIRLIDPNMELLYTKILNHGVNNFDITITKEGKTFTTNMTITR